MLSAAVSGSPIDFVKWQNGYFCVELFGGCLENMAISGIGFFKGRSSIFFSFFSWTNISKRYALLFMDYG